VVTLYGRSATGDYVQHDIRKFEPYFYAKFEPYFEDEVERWLGGSSEIIRTEEVERFLPNGYQVHPVKMVRIVTKSPGDVSKLRDVIIRNGWGQVYEADIIFTNRFLVDKGIGGMSWVEATGNNVRLIERSDDAPLRLLGFDIECLPPEHGVPTPDKHPVIMVTVAVNRPEREVKAFLAFPKEYAPEELQSRPDLIWCTDERTMLQTFKQFILQYNPDIITGYNSNRFDFDYLLKRYSVYGMDFNIGRDGRPCDVSNFGEKVEVRCSGRVVFDTMNIIKDNYSLDSYSLSNVAHKLIDKEKLDVKPSEMRQLWLDGGLSRFVEYALKDADLVLDLVEELRLIDKYSAICKASGVLLHDCMNGGQTIRLESLLLRAFRQNNRVFPLKPKGEVVGEDFKGALVYAEKGIHENVIICDFTSLYSSIIRAYNISWDTIINDPLLCGENVIKTPNGAEFVSKAQLEGILPKILAELYQKRVDAKALMKSSKDPKSKAYFDDMQNAFKIILNSAYGMCGQKRSRLYDQRIASAVTSIGRETITNTQKIVESMLLSVKLKTILLDTDSLYLSSDKDITPSEAESIGSAINVEMSKHLPPPMNFAFEAFARRIMILERKRYMALLVDSNGKQKMKVRGIEIVRRDWSQLTKEVMKHCFDLILIEGKTEEALKYCRDVIQKVEQLQNIKDNKELADKLILSKKIGRNASQYKCIQPHVTVMERMKQRGEPTYGLGDRIPYFVLPGDGPISLRVDHPDFVRENGGRIDTSWYVEVQLVGPLARVFEALGISKERLTEKSKQKSLFDF